MRSNNKYDLTLISVFTVTGLSNTAYSVIAPFLPFQFKSKGAP